MTRAPGDSPTCRHRLRIRFRKEGDLRWISHRDLLRVFERLFRRAGWELSMTEGFHPKVRMNFPSALALGVLGLDEVMEVELVQPGEPGERTQELRNLAPPGLTIETIERVSPEQGKARLQRLTYSFPVPEERRPCVTAALQDLMSQPSCLIRRDGRPEPLDLRADLESLELTGSELRMALRVGRTASVRPREVLAALGLADLEGEGYYLTRTAVELAP